MIEQAFVLGAGLGARLRPLTDQLPKPLVPVFGKPLITFALDHLAKAGVRSFVINTHHLPEQFEQVFTGGTYHELPVRLLHEPRLLETGGGIKNAEASLGEKPFLVYSGDILTDLALTPLLEEHFQRGNDVTLALRETGLAAQVAFRDGNVLDIGHRLGHAGNLDYANISIWNPSAFARFSLGEKISFVPILTQWISEGGRIGGVLANDGKWFNLGSPAQYLEAHRAIWEQHWRPDYVLPNEWPVRIARDAVVHSTAQIIGCSSVGAGCRIGADAVVEASVLWPGVEIASRARLKSCIVRAHRAVAGSHTNEVI
ncbi:MAG: sugar phosphate nucleotidyltransferase [Chthoniobacterales bacterium]